MKKNYVLLLACFVAFLFFSIKLQAQCIPTVIQAGATDNYMNNFSFGPLANLASGDNQNDYVLYPQSGSFTRGSSYTYSIQSGSVTWAQAAGIWIDYNGNNVFTDAGEFVYASAAPVLSNVTLTGSITIPIGTSLGVKRMRVCSKSTSAVLASESCGISVYGEYEDYNIVIISSTACSGSIVAGNAVALNTSPCAGSNLQITLSGAPYTSSLSYLWQQSTNCTGAWTYISTVSNPSAATPILNITPSAGSSMAYRCQVICNATSISSFSTSTCVTPQPWSCTSSCYGISAATILNSTKIFNVSMGSLNNTTTCGTPLIGTQGVATGLANRYANFTDAGGVPSAIIYKSVPQDFSITIGACNSSSFPALVTIYIDYNHNNSFDDAGEEVYSNTNIPIISPDAVINGSFTVPSNALSGCTRMRVVNKSASLAPITSTGPYKWGETEDYSVDILVAPDSDPAISAMNPPAGNCFSDNETITATICNYGTTSIDLAIHNAIVELTVNGPNGINTYPVILNSGILGASGTNCATASFSGINLYNGGNYLLNVSVSIPTLVNNLLFNDTLSLPISLLNNRPPSSVDYTLCQGNGVAPGQGLILNGCAPIMLDSVTLNFTVTGPCIDNIGSTDPGNSPGPPSNCADEFACQFAVANMPTLPPGSIITTDAVLTVTNLGLLPISTYQTLPNEVRMNLYGAFPIGAELLSPGAEGSNINFPVSDFSYTRSITVPEMQYLISTLDSNDVLNLGYWESFNDTVSASDIFINASGTTVASLKIYYQYTIPAYAWYETPTGGSSLYAYNNFNPLSVPNGIIGNSNYPGTYTFYAACVNDTTCRLPVNLNVNPIPVIQCISSNDCENNGVGTASVNASFTLNITAPAPYQFAMAGAVFGPSVTSNSLIGEIVYYPNANTGCSVYPPGAFAGKIALIDRGSCFFESKVYNAQNAGAIGVIIVNNNPNSFFGPGQVNLHYIYIPCVMISQADGLIIKNMLSQPSSVFCETTPSNYSFLWNTGATTSNITSITAGPYSVTVTNPEGCVSSCNFNLESGTVPIVTAKGTSDCNLQGNGSAAVTIHNHPYELYIDYPVIGQVPMAGANFGPDIETFPLNGYITYFPQDTGCIAYTSPVFNGTIAMIDRGGCFFETKVYNAQNAGAIGVIIVNNVPDPIFTMGAANLYNITIPAIMVSQADGQAIKDLFLQNPLVIGRTRAYGYSWLRMSDNTFFATTPVATGLFPDNYQVIVGNGGCNATAPYAVLGSIQAPTITSISKPNLCADSVVLEASGAGTGIDLNGVDQWVDLGAYITNLDDANFTIEAWIKTTGINEGVVVSSNNDNIPEVGEHALYIDNLGRPTFRRLEFVGFGGNYIIGLPSVNDGNWHHVAVTWDYLRSIGRMYVDGVDQTLLDEYEPSLAPLFGTFSIGRPNFNDAVNFFSGEIDEVKIWNTSRLQHEILKSMSNPESVNAYGLVAYYKMNEGDGVLTKDLVNGYNGTLINAPFWINSGAFGYTYLWSTTQNTQQINVTNTGSYHVSMTASNGCVSSSDMYNVNSSAGAQTIPNGSTTFCTGGSVTLSVDSSIMEKRFASSVLDFSSQYTINSWGTLQALGKPDVYPVYGDIGQAWASLSGDGFREHLELGFLNPAPINFIDIYETLNPGAIDTVFVKNPNTGLFEVVYATSAVIEAQVSRILHITFPTTSFPVSEIRIAINSPYVPSWNEIDAVAIGKSPNIVWSSGATTPSITVDTTGNYNYAFTYPNSCTNSSNVVSTNELPCTISLQLKLFIEGYYIGGNTMTTALLNQGIGSSNTITDFIDVFLYNQYFPYNVMDSSTSILNTNGSALATFNAPSDAYYVVIKHRSAVQTWSAYPVTLNASPILYDYSTGYWQAYGNNLIQVDPNVWALYNGDINQDMAIDAFDYVLLDPDLVIGASGYLTTDINGDGSVDAFDYVILDSNLIFGIGAIIP